MTVAIDTSTGLPETVTRPGPGQRFALFCWEYVRQTKGRWAGKRLVLESFQRDFADELFRTGPDGRRIYQEAVLGIPRKNGKSTLASALALYLLIADGEDGPEVYVAAASKKQARIIFDESKKYVRRSPGLQDFVRPYKDSIVCADNDGKLEVVSSDAPLQHGLNPSGNVIDELHAHRDGDLYDALTSGSGAREQPLTVTISTAGVDLEGPLGEFYSKMTDAAQVDLTRPSPYLTIGRDIEGGVLFWWYGAPRDANVDDEAVWLASNPASWITTDYLRRERRKKTMRLSTYRRLHLNQWTSSEDDWILAEDWAACQVGEHPPDDEAWLHGLDPALPVAVAIDVGIRHDNSSITVGQRQERPTDETGRPTARTIARQRRWANPFPEGHREHDEWELDIAVIRNVCRALRRVFPVAAAIDADTKRPHPGPAFVFDPWKFKESAQILKGEGLHMIDFPQYDRYVVPACNLTYELVQTRRLEHDGDPILAEHVGNAVAVEVDRGWRIRKPRKAPHKHIDAAATLTMAVYQAQVPAPKSERRPRIGVGF